MSITPTLLTPEDILPLKTDIATLQTQYANLKADVIKLRADVDKLMLGTTPPPPANKAPVLNGIVPTITFSPGVAARISVASYFTDPDGDPLTITDFSPNGLPPGVTYSAATKEFVYDGNPTGGTTGGNVITADDGRGI